MEPVQETSLIALLEQDELFNVLILKVLSLKRKEISWQDFKSPFPYQESYDQTTAGLLCVTLYKMFLVSYRMLCLAVFASLYRGYLILLLFTHSLIMLLWILYLDSSFSSSNHEVSSNYHVT
jgi:hypothetical protein